MLRTKHFFILVVFLIVFGVLWFFMNTNTEESQYELSEQSVVIIAKPQDTFSVESSTSFDSKIKRTIFIEKIRNALPDIVSSQNIKKEPVKSVQQDASLSLSAQRQPNPEIVTKLSTSSHTGLNIKPSTSTLPFSLNRPSTTNASSSTSTLGQLLE